MNKEEELKKEEETSIEDDIYKIKFEVYLWQKYLEDKERNPEKYNLITDLYVINKLKIPMAAGMLGPILERRCRKEKV